MTIDKPTEIYDPIFGFITLNQEQKKIVSHPFFQRLHNILQLGPAYLVYPSARSSRFAHSLGVFALTCKILDNLKKMDYNKTALGDRTCVPLQIAALSHDIGHLPFSHCTEDVIKDYLIKKSSFVEDELTKKRSNKDVKFHEWLSGRIMLTTDIYSNDEYKSDILQIITGESITLIQTQILHSELDVDRLEYLFRDSYNTGIGFGKIDYEQILRQQFVYSIPSNIPTVGKQEIIVYSKKAIQSLDNFWLARILMYKTVYYHKNSVYFSHLVSESFKILIELDDKSIIAQYLPIKLEILFDYIINYEQIKESPEIKNQKLSVFIENWMKFDDNYLLTIFKNVYYCLTTHQDDSLTNELKLLKKYLHNFINRITGTLLWEYNQLFREEKEELTFDQQKVLFESFKQKMDSVYINHIQTPLITIINKVKSPLKQAKNGNIDLKTEQIEIDKIIFFEMNKKEPNFCYINNIGGSINYRQKSSQFYIVRVFCLNKINDANLKEKLFSEINQLFTEIKDKLTKC